MGFESRYAGSTIGSSANKHPLILKKTLRLAGSGFLLKGINCGSNGYFFICYIHTFSSIYVQSENRGLTDSLWPAVRVRRAASQLKAAERDREREK